MGADLISTGIMVFSLAIYRLTYLSQRKKQFQALCDHFVKPQKYSVYYLLKLRKLTNYILQAESRNLDILIIHSLDSLSII